MKNIGILLVVIIMATACNSSVKQDEKKSNRYHTTDPSRLYFKNIRSSSYSEKQLANRMDVYKHKKFDNTNERPIIYPTIVNNWMGDEAYLFIEKNTYPNYGDSLIIKWEQGKDNGQFMLTLPTKDDQYDFIKQIYEGIKKGQELTLKTKEGIYVPIFQNKEDQTQFVVTVNDYYKLTEQY